MKPTKRMLITVFLGFLGVHKFMDGKIGMGFLYLFTMGLGVIAYRDGVKYGIQCKCYSSDIGNKAVQEAFAGKTYYNCHVAAVLTNRHFTKSAKELAENNKVLLWDREKLEEFVQNSHYYNTNYN